MSEKKQEMVMMTQEQFTALISKVTEANESGNRHFKSFAACTKRYDGERNFDKVEEFVTGISVYKKIEKISDEDALEGLTLLLTGAAATWWNGVKSDIKKWTQALDAIKSAFAPKMQPHEIYLELYSKKQTTEEIDAFVCQKRALLAQLPAKRHKEEEHLDFVYGLLNITYKKEIARTEVKTFAELLDRGRHIESLLKEVGDQTTSTPTNPTSMYSVDIYLNPDEGTILTNNEQKMFKELLIEHSDIFEKNTEPTPFTQHRIDTGNHPPISVKPYRLSLTRQKQLREKLDDMIKNDVIEECDSPWSAPVILVPKGETDVRVCVDYRRLNEITKPDRYPLPRIDDLLHQAKAMPYMSTIDLQSSYWQIMVHPDDYDKTSFVSPFGTYRFKRMPFGLRNAPATFQRLMDKFIQGLHAECVLSYLDDLIIRSITFSQHKKDLREVFIKLREYKLRANRKKCKFMCSEIKYLGHLIVTDGIKTDPEKISAIANRQAPKNLKQLISFLQTASWYRRFIHNFADIARPLTNLTKKKISWKWEREQQEAFMKLKDALTTSPVLKQASDDLPFAIKTDASQYAIGAALVQGEGDNEHPVEYASRLLTQAECNYSVTEKEALAIVWAISKFRGYIEGTKFITITDHQPLKWLMNLKTPTGRLARWALQLQPYEFKIQYTPGRTNVVADTLSRPPCEEHDGKCFICSTELELPRHNEKQLRDEQMKDDTLQSIIKILEEGKEIPSYVEYIKKGYLVHKGVLYLYTPEQENDNAKLVVPRHEIQNVLNAYHDSPTAGHMGVERTVQRITNNFYWTGLRKDVIKYVKTCVECQKYKPSNKKPAGLYQSTPNSQRFEVLSIDLFGPLPKGSSGEKWILIIEDTTSRWVELFPLNEATSENCANILLSEIFLRYGLPRKIISDNGVQFISAIMQKLAYCLEIQQIFTPVYHPEPNVVERKNRDMK